MYLKIIFLNGETYPLEVRPDMTIGDLKRRIEEHSGVAALRQRLSNGINFDDDTKTLGQLGLLSHSTVKVLVTDPPIPPPFQVFLKNEKGQTSTYNVGHGETVTEFKAKVYNKERVPVDQQRLIHEGRQLDDGRKLVDYGIKSESTIFLTLRLRGG